MAEARDLMAFYGMTVLQNKSSLDETFQECIIDHPCDELPQVREEIIADMKNIDAKFSVFYTTDSETGRIKADIEKMTSFNEDCHNLRRKIMSYLADVTAVLSLSNKKT